MEYQQIVVVIFVIFVPWINAGHDYKMEKYCGKQLSMMMQSEYQLELELTDNYIYNNNNNLSWLNKDQKHTCEVTVAAWYGIYPKMVLHFDDLDLDCRNGHLEFYVGPTTETRVAGLEDDICGGKEPKGSFKVDTPFLHIKYVPSRAQYIKDVFSITITAYTDGTCPANSHKCENSLCINKGIDCDEIASEDDSDDDDDDTHNVAPIIGVIIGCFCLVGVIAGMIVCCTCCKRTTRKKTVVQNQYQQSPVTVTSTGQQQGFSQPIYNVGQAVSYQTLQQSYPLPPSGPIPSAPETMAQQNSYQGPAELFSYENIPTSPPPYAEIFGQPQPCDQAPPLSAKQEHVHVELDSAKA